MSTFLPVFYGFERVVIVGCRVDVIGLGVCNKHLWENIEGDDKDEEMVDPEPTLEHKPVPMTRIYLLLFLHQYNNLSFIA